MENVRTRFAPSPTGYLHVGGARTALYNYLFARHNGGKFVLRIEDTDVIRSTAESEKALIDALQWLHLNWDEGPDVGGKFGPYRQSERLSIYHKYANELLKKGNAYECYAYPEEIEQLKEEQLNKGKPPRLTYNDVSRFSTFQRKRDFERGGLKPGVIFKMERKARVLDDLVKGRVRFGENAAGDFFLLRSSGMPTYNFAVVIDDAMMKITHVIRGDDHLSNTLRQMTLYDALGFDLPKFAHVSMILGPDKKRLSKRHGAVAIEYYRDSGYLSEAMLNYLVLLGWSHSAGKEVLSIDEMCSAFTIERLSSSPAIFDGVKLKHLNGLYIRHLDINKITELTIPYLAEAGFEVGDMEFSWLMKAVDSVREECTTLKDMPEKLSIYLRMPQPDSYTESLLNTEKVRESLIILKGKFSQAKDELTDEDLTNLVKDVLKEIKIKGKVFYPALRYVLTGKKVGPKLLSVLSVLGKERVIQRIDNALNE
ncbi:MAG: glutamate--tRNA ligase [Thermotogae bacterium]|nr:glutamate--tRNA ligase [Thermotogota bacterium]